MCSLISQSHCVRGNGVNANGVSDHGERAECARSGDGTSS
jgi:hypothetical protein